VPGRAAAIGRASADPRPRHGALLPGSADWPNAGRGLPDKALRLPPSTAARSDPGEARVDPDIAGAGPGTGPRLFRAGISGPGRPGPVPPGPLRASVPDFLIECLRVHEWDWRSRRRCRAVGDAGGPCRARAAWLLDHARHILACSRIYCVAWLV
jgi:hypothetical protein